MAEVTGAAEMRDLSARLKAMGTDGKKLRRKLSKGMNEAVIPLAKEISDVEHLKPYMPDEYALVLSADLTSRIRNSMASATPRVEVLAKAKEHKRKVVLLDRGIINHPIYATGPRKTWRWSNGQRKGMRPGFFTDAVKDQSPQIRDKILQVMAEVAKEVTGN